MPLSLEQFAESLTGRKDLHWPAAPELEPIRAKPHLKKLANIRAVVWNVYGTLLNISGGILLLQHPNDFVMEVALEKTIHEFKMWKAMTRKPGNPAHYMRLMLQNVIDELKFTSIKGEKYPELATDQIWLQILKKLMQNEYTYIVSQMGSLQEYAEKIAYFYHASLQGTAAYPGAARTLHAVHEQLGWQGLLADGQCCTWVQLKRQLAEQEPTMDFDMFLPADRHVLSYKLLGKKPSERLLRAMLTKLSDRGIEPEQTLHVGSSIDRDLLPAKKFGMRTALFAGDKNSIQATNEQLKNPDTRPDVMLTQLDQITEVI